MFKEMIACQSDLVFNSAFKSKTKEQAERSEMIRQNFLQRSKSKEQASSQKKRRKSTNKSTKFIIQSNEKLKYRNDTLVYDNEDLALRPNQVSQNLPSIDQCPASQFTTLHQQQPHPILMPITKDFLSPPSPSGSSIKGFIHKESLGSSRQHIDLQTKGNNQGFIGKMYGKPNVKPVGQSNDNIFSINIENNQQETLKASNSLKVH